MPSDRAGPLPLDAPEVVHVVAVDRRFAIGRGNAMPWHLPEDFAHFKRVTMGHPMVMGRATFDSIGRPLPGRTTIVVTRDPAWRHDGVEVAQSIDDALARAAALDAEVMIAGGAQVYAATMDQADRLEVTHVDLDVHGADAWYPAIDPEVFELTGERAGNSAGVSLRWATYRRRRETPGHHARHTGSSP